MAIISEAVEFDTAYTRSGLLDTALTEIREYLKCDVLVDDAGEISDDLSDRLPEVVYTRDAFNVCCDNSMNTEIDTSGVVDDTTTALELLSIEANMIVAETWHEITYSLGQQLNDNARMLESFTVDGVGYTSNEVLVGGYSVPDTEVKEVPLPEDVTGENVVDGALYINDSKTIAWLVLGFSSCSYSDPTHTVVLKASVCVDSDEWEDVENSGGAL